jgi:hypothetical protein
MRPTDPSVGPVDRRPVPPYNTGKVKIGLCYVPPATWSASRDSRLLQTALLAAPVARVTPAERLLTFFRSFV